MLQNLAFLITTFLNGIVGNFISFKINKDVIVDPIHVITQDWRYDDPKAVMVKDILVFAPVTLMAMYNPVHALSMGKLYGLCSILRPICYLSTSLPPPNKRFTRIVTNPLQTLSGSRGDLIYSGHMTFLTSSLMVLNRFYNVSPFLIAGYLGLAGFLTSSTRSHYTVDVTVALIITLLITALISSARPETCWGRLGEYIFT